MDRFQLGWKLGTVGDCCTDAFTGKSPKYSKTKTEYRIIGQQANQRYGIDLRYVKYGTTEFGDAQEDRFFLRYNDVILNTLGTGSIGRSGIYKRREPILTDGHPFVFRTSEICLPDYLFHYLRYSEKQIIDSASGSTNQRFLKLKSFLLFPIPIPPIDEQERIVARIEELFSQLDAGVKTLKKTKAQLAVYRQAVLKEAFDSVSGAGAASIESQCKNIVDCPHSTPKWSNEGYLCLRTTNFKRGRLDLSEKNYVTKETFDIRNARLIPLPGDVLYSREGAILGIACIIPKDTYVCLGQRMMLLRAGERLNNKYLMYFLNSPAVTNYVASITGGSASPHVNVGDIKAFMIQCPNITTQERIVLEIDSRFSVCDSIEQTVDTALQQAEAMLQSILKNAFEGGI